ncbi:MAG: EF-hand domain-containing protein [Gammaproteobacteria bacterium]|nr:EF-hand domain-containing protein [Gammaproteobacteria bacterium]
MNKDHSIKGALLASLLAAGAVAAQAPPEPPGAQTMPGEQVAPTFESVDVNQDSLISEQEATSAKAMTPEAFTATDANKDGYLSREEFDQGA